MIAPLRRRHRWLLPLVALVTLPLTVAALIGREPADRWVPEPGTTSIGTAPWVQAELPVLSVDDTSIEGVTIELLEDGATRRLALRATTPLTAPVVLVYWSTDASTSTETGLPVDATLLGSFDGEQQRRYRLDGPLPGTVVLYSLGHQTVIGTADLSEEG
ncbi:MAG: hypothetical protein AAGD38_14575 [Acidobacteriota bacterium]